jgi:hypothetical protein
MATGQVASERGGNRCRRRTYATLADGVDFKTRVMVDQKRKMWGDGGVQAILKRPLASLAGQQSGLQQLMGQRCYAFVVRC